MHTGTRRPPITVTLVCLGVQCLYLCSYSVVIPLSYRLTGHILKVEADDSGLSVKLWSGILIGVQNVAFGIAIYVVRYKLLHRERCIITVSLIFSMLGSVMFAVGATQDESMEVSLGVLLVARIFQGVGAGVDFTAKYAITSMSSTDVLSVYNSYWSMACAVGTSAGPLLVCASTLIPGAENWNVRFQSAVPLLLLCCIEFGLLIVHVRVFPASVSTTANTGGADREVISMTRADRGRKIAVSVFLGFIRHFIRTAWEAVVSIALEQRFGFHLTTTTFLLSLCYLTSIPTQKTFVANRKTLCDSGWMHAMCGIAAVGTALIWVGLAGSCTDTLCMCFFLLGSLLFYNAMSVHATVSDVVGVKFADPADKLYNPANVILAQILAKGFVGRSSGPVAGRLSVHRQWHGFPVLSLVLIVSSELLTVFVLETESASSASELELIPMNSGEGAQHAAENIRVTQQEELIGRSQLRITSVVTLCAHSWKEFRTSERCVAFARLKHGDATIMQQAAHDVALSIKTHPLAGFWLRTNPLNVCIIAPAYRKALTIGSYLAWEIQQQLASMIGSPVKLFHVKRRSITKGDFAALDMTKRRSTLANQFYFDEPDLLELNGKNCVLVDDAIMYGTHCQETTRTLEGHGIDRNQILAFTYLAATPDLLEAEATIEHDLNKAFIPTVEMLQQILGQAQLPVTLRLLKLLLSLPMETLGTLVDWMATARPDALNVIRTTSKEEDLKDRDRFSPGTRSSKVQASSLNHGPGDGSSPPVPAVLVRHGQSTANVEKEANLCKYLYLKFVDRVLVDACLTPQGEADARRVGVELFGGGSQAPAQIGLVVVSPLRRALQTAALVLQDAGTLLPKHCRVVAHPSAAEHFFTPDIAENRPATDTLPAGITEVAGHAVDFSLCHEWAKKSRFTVGLEQPRRVTEADIDQNAKVLREFIFSATAAGSTALVFSHQGVIKALSGRKILPGAALKTDDWCDWRLAVALQ